MSQNSVATLNINDNQANYARKISARMSSPMVRKKALVDILAIKCVADYFVNFGYRVNTLRSLHAIPEIFEEFKISDIYINNYRIDVISQFRDDKIKIPSTHKEYSCAPDFYVVVRMSDRLKDAEILGYFKASEVAFLKDDSGFTQVDEIYLKSMATLHQELKKPVRPRQILGKHQDCVSLFLRFVDGELTLNSKKLLIQHLMTCPACTKKLSDVLEFNRAIRGIDNISALAQSCQRATLSIGEKTVLSSYDEDLSEAKQTYDETDIINRYAAQDERYRSIIDGIFDKVTKIEPSGLASIIGDRKKKIILTAACVLLFLFVSIGIAMKNSNSDISSISDADTYTQEANFDNSSQGDVAPEQNLPEEVYGISSGSDYSIASQTTGEPLIATINKVSWEVPENLANKANYTRFLQLVGKNVKLNLQNDLLLSSDFAKNNVIKLSIRIASNGDVIGMKILQSSGSEPIDNIIKKSVSETLSYMKPPSHGIMARPVDVTLVISL